MKKILFSIFAAFASKWMQGGRGGIFFAFPLCILGMMISQKPTKKGTLFWMFASVLSMGGLLAEAIILKMSDWLITHFLYFF